MIKITVRERSHDWLAFMDGEQATWECGSAPCSAIGALVLSHPERFGVAVKIVEEPESFGLPATKAKVVQQEVAG